MQRGADLLGDGAILLRPEAETGVLPPRIVSVLGLCFGFSVSG